MKQKNRVDYQLRIPPEEVWRRIVATSDERQVAFFSASRYHGEQPFLRSVSGNRITIDKRRFYRNDFSSSLIMVIEQTPTGSRLRGNFTMGVLPKIFLTGWLFVTGSLSFIAIAHVLVKIFARESVALTSLADFTPLLMFIGGLFLLGFGRLLAKSEEQAIICWLDNLLADALYLDLLASIKLS